ncbi:MAG: 16S rRNA (uracil(1498)-N(3))-methyltransferase [Flavobacteriaceae bacterium]|nr:16S rRNA (uracil(1498)-N(3))-methyltransferase [Flavobacteriaceae bacterium]
MPGHFTFYSNKINNNIADFDLSECKHAIGVLRYSLGDGIWFTDGFGKRYYGIISVSTKTGFQVEIKQTVLVDPLPGIHVFMAILKSRERMEWAVEKCSELGVNSFTFFHADRGERAKLNVDRMNKVAISSLKQSHGAWITNVAVLGFDAICRVGLSSPLFHKYIAFCSDSKKISPPEIQYPMALLIGPEGDFSTREIEISNANNWIPLHCGNQILRSETAVVSVAAALRLSSR